MDAVERSASEKPLEEFLCQGFILSIMDLPAHDGLVPDIDDGVGIEEQPPDGAGKPGDVPTPDLIRSCGKPFRWLCSGFSRPCRASMVKLVLRFENTIDRTDTSHIASFFQKSEKDLIGILVSIGWAATELDDALLLISGEFSRNPLGRSFSSVAVSFMLPSKGGPGGDSQEFTGLLAASPTLDCFIDQLKGMLPLL